MWEACCWYSGVINMFLNCLITCVYTADRVGKATVYSTGNQSYSRSSMSARTPAWPPRNSMSAH